MNEECNHGTFPKPWQLEPSTEDMPRPFVSVGEQKVLAGEKRPRVLPWHRKLSVFCSVLGFRALLHASGIVHNKLLFELPENEFSQLQVTALKRKLFSEQHGKVVPQAPGGVLHASGYQNPGSPTWRHIHTYIHIYIYIYISI